MPAISKIRFTNVVYEQGAKRFQDEIFRFDGHNGVILLENGGGKTVFVQVALQAVLPNEPLAGRKLRDTLVLENEPAHIAVEWIINERPRRYALTAVTLFAGRDGVNSYKYVYEYSAGDEHGLEHLPLVRKGPDGRERPAGREEMHDYYQRMSQDYPLCARLFSTVREYQAYIEENYRIIPSEWKSIALINSSEGGVERFFESCQTTSQLVDNLLIPAVEGVMAGEGASDFVEIFADQRKDFDKYRQLVDKIAENKRVQERIEKYVEVLGRFKEADDELYRQKQELKALHELATMEKDQVTGELGALQDARGKWAEADERLRHEEESLKLAFLRQELERLAREWDIIRQERDETKVEYDRRMQRYEELELACYRKKLQEKEEMVVHYKRQIEEADSSPEISELTERLARTESALWYVISQEEHGLEAVAEQASKEHEDVKRALTQLEDQRKNEEKRHREMLVKKGELESRVHSLEQDMREILGRILSSPGDDLAVEKDKWEKRLSDLHQAEQELFRLTKDRERETQVLAEEIPSLRRQLEKCKDSLAIIGERMKHREENEKMILARVKEAIPDLFDLNSLYLKQEMITNRLELKLEQLRSEKEELVRREKQAERLSDLYRESTSFTADPLVSSWVQGVSEQFDYLEAGAAYVEKAARYRQRTVADLYEAYPWWAITVITSDGEMDKAQKRLADRAEELSHPVLILGSREARDIVDGATRVETVRGVFPGNWSTNLDPDAFGAWKEQIQAIAADLGRTLVQKEQTLEILTHLLHDLKEYWRKYPYEDYQQMTQELRQLREESRELTALIDAKELRREAIAREIKQFGHDQAQVKDEISHLSQRISEAERYRTKLQAREKILAEQVMLIAALEEKEREIEVLQGRAYREREKSQELIIRIGDLRRELKALREEEIYHQVKGKKPLATDAPRAVLLREREDLKAKLMNRQKGRAELEAHLTSQLEGAEEFRKEIDKWHRRHRYQVDETVAFPVDGEYEMERVMAEVERFSLALKEIEPREDKARAIFKAKETELQVRSQDFYQRYPDVVSFTEPLPEAELRLKRERQQLDRQQSHLERLLQQAREQEEDINRALHTLTSHRLSYLFLAEEVLPAALSDQLRTDFPYQRIPAISASIQALERAQRQAEERMAEADVERRRFESFCQTEITDPKLRQKVMDGLTYRAAYEEVVDWQRRMNDRIAHSVRIAEDGIRQHDQQIQQFIGHLHSHLVTVAAELRTIARKTRVKLAEGTAREIYTIDVPEWDETKAKEGLLRHIGWMLEQLSSEKYQDEMGVENQVLVKRDVEKWLGTPQLLRRVMDPQTIRVKCRKVTGDGRISSAPVLWESTHRWSGGEKWSKNMALFLGVLNYQAEKRRHLGTLGKRSRTVILDNPFGQASSEHVLDPVFFIAEQLGFQIIALTALAEGKFVRNYFPVVYSCRLRPTVSGGKEIISVEQEIAEAYFQDHEPETLKRIGTAKQPALF